MSFFLERCNSTTLTHAIIKYPNGSHADIMVRDGEESLEVSCEDGYELDSEKYREKHTFSESVCCYKGKFYKQCNNGAFTQAIKCIESEFPL